MNFGLYLSWIDPPLTTVQLPQQEIGAEAARLLLESIASPGGAAKRLLLRCRLVIRGSTAAPV